MREKAQGPQRGLALVFVVALLTAACGGGDAGTADEGTAAEETGAEEAGTAAEETAAEGETAAGGGQEGGRVTVLTGFPGEEGEPIEAVLDAFSEETGIEVVHTGTPDIEQEIEIAISGGNPPDISFIPQPAALREYFAQDAIRPLDDVVDVDALEASLVPGTIDTARAESGELIAVPFRSAVKSLVWYNVAAFAEGGYEIPESIEDLEALSQTAVDDGVAPWCLADNEGWILTDWLEEMVLRTSGAEVYDQWIAHEIPFDAPEIQTAAQAFEDLVLADGRVLGGREAVPGLEWQSVVEPLRTGGCLMYRQGSFFRDILPDDVTVGEDGDINTFYLPAGETGGVPVLGFGDQASLLTDNPAAQELIRYLAQPDSAEPWAQAGSFLSPHAEFDTSLYPDETTRSDGDIVGTADPFRFDASDLMPAAVGAGSFWTGMLSWAGGQQDLETSLSGIEESWPSS